MTRKIKNAVFYKQNTAFLAIESPLSLCYNEIMNLLHMKYAVEIAEMGSINKAAEKLFVGQPNLSRAIKELEASLGVTIFDRSTKGMCLTPDGEVFIRHAKTVLKQIDAIEDMFQNGSAGKKRFSISVPRASYITDAFAAFSAKLQQHSEVDIFFKETNSAQTVKNVLQEDYKLGILRYAQNHDAYYKALIHDNKLKAEPLAEFRYMLLMSRENPLAEKKDITYDDLKDCIEVSHADLYVPSMPFAEMKKEELPGNIKRRIHIFERGSQFELLTQNPETFMWASPIPAHLLKRYNLVQCSCAENKRLYRDVLVHRQDYTLTDLDKTFIDALHASRDQIFRNV